jgi:hypothetical protein
MSRPIVQIIRDPCCPQTPLAGRGGRLCPCPSSNSAERCAAGPAARHPRRRFDRRGTSPCRWAVPRGSKRVNPSPPLPSCRVGTSRPARLTARRDNASFQRATHYRKNTLLIARRPGWADCPRSAREPTTSPGRFPRGYDQGGQCPSALWVRRVGSARVPSMLRRSE